MLKPFDYEIQGNTLFADALKVRRGLLENTDGRAWIYIRDLDTLKTEAVKLSDAAKTPEVDAQTAINALAVVRLEGILAQATRNAFDMIPVDPETGVGVSEYEALLLLQKFMEYAEGKG